MLSRDRIGVAAIAVLALAAPAAQAVPACPQQPAKRVIASGGGVLESAIVDKTGRLYYTDTGAKELRRIDRPGAAPRTVIRNLASGGGLAFRPDGRLLVGYGDAAANGTNPSAGGAGLMLYDPRNGRSRVYVKGLSMANGVALGPDGTIYASDDFLPGGIDRLRPGKTLERLWGNVLSANGLAVNAAGTALYANQTFVPAAIAKVALPTGKVSTYYKAPVADMSAGLDGMVMDPKGRLFVAANLAGQVWRVARGTACLLVAGLQTTSAVAIGRGRKGFRAGDLVAVGFDGKVVYVAGGAK